MDKKPIKWVKEQSEKDNMIQKQLKSGRVVTISDFHLEKTSNRVLAVNPDNMEELYDFFSYPKDWGENRPAIVKKDYALIIRGILPEYFVSIWFESNPISNKSKYGSQLIVCFFTDLIESMTISELIDTNLTDLDAVFDNNAEDFDL